MAFNRPGRGRVLIDGKDLASVQLGDYREQTASVLQENFLFDGTIAENIAYARPSASMDQIRQACQIAHCEEFILQFPKDYSTIVGERGIKLSGGQRQRVSIARAIVHKPLLVLADEPTGELDSANARSIFGLFKEMVLDQGISVISATHDSTLLSMANKVQEIRNGLLQDGRNEAPRRFQQ